MRLLPTASALTAAAVAPLLLSTTAHAVPASTLGTVTVHDASTGAEAGRDGPAVCTFFLDAVNFVGSQRISWDVVEQTGDGETGTVAETGTLTVDREGEGRTGDLSLADGSYQLLWTDRGDTGAEESEYFTVGCGKEDAGTEQGADGGSATDPDADPDADPDTDADTDAGAEPDASSPSASPSAPASSAPSPAPVFPRDGADSGPGASAPSEADGQEPQAAPEPESSVAAVSDEDGDLAASGAGVPVSALITGAVCLLGAGTYLVLRHRNTRHARP